MTGYQLSDLAKYTQTRLLGDPGIKIHGVGSLASAKPGQIAFFSDQRHSRWLADTAASAIILTDADHRVAGKPVLIAPNPSLTFARIAELFSTEPKPAAGIDPTAIIAANCQIGENVAIAAGVCIGENVKVGDHSVVGMNCTINTSSSIGSGCRLYANVTIAHHVRLGNRVIIHSGAVIGADGFGMTQDEKKQWVKMPQCGGVVLCDDVEIGANTTIDRGTLEDTVLGEDVRIDNLVQIGHNVRVGRHTAIAGCSGIAGSAKIGKNCLIGGSVKINGHIEICDNAVIAACSLVAQSITTPGKHTEWNPLMQLRSAIKKQHQRIVQMQKRLSTLEKILNRQDQL